MSGPPWVSGFDAELKAIIGEDAEVAEGALFHWKQPYVISTIQTYLFLEHANELSYEQKGELT